MLAQVAQPGGPPTEEALHQYRILVKRARYAAEFATKSPEADRLIAQLKRALDALGDWHDWLTLTHSAAHRLGDVHESSLVAVLHNVTGAKFRRAIAALPAAQTPTPAIKAVLQSVPSSQTHAPRRGAKTPVSAAQTNSAA